MHFSIVSSHEKYLKKALKALSMGFYSKKGIVDFDSLNKEISLYQSKLEQWEYDLIWSKDIIRDYKDKYKDTNETLTKAKNLLKKEYNYHIKIELSEIIEKLEYSLSCLDFNYDMAQKWISELPKCIENASFLINELKKVEPQCRVEEIKALNKGKNYEYFAVA